MQHELLKTGPAPQQVRPLFGSCWLCLFVHLRGLLSGHGWNGLATDAPKTGSMGRNH